jgi:hypothetical protein
MIPARSLSLHARHHVLLQPNAVRLAYAPTSYSRLSRSMMISKKLSSSALFRTGPASTPNVSIAFHGSTVNSHRHSALWAAVHFAQILADHHRQLFRCFLFLCRGLHCLAL